MVHNAYLCRLCDVYYGLFLVGFLKLTGYQIVVEEVREHVLDASRDVDPSNEG